MSLKYQQKYKTRSTTSHVLSVDTAYRFMSVSKHPVQYYYCYYCYIIILRQVHYKHDKVHVSSKTSCSVFEKEPHKDGVNHQSRHLSDQLRITAKARRWPNAGIMLGQRRRRWPYIKPLLSQRLLFAGITKSTDVRHQHIFHCNPPSF